MYRLMILVLGVSVLQRSPLSTSDIQALLSRGESLYYEARFADSISVLQPLDAALEQHPERVQDRIVIKLDLALAHIGLNESQAAKALFADILALDPMFSLDAERFAPKIIQLFDEAKAESSKTSCVRICDEVDRQRRTGNLDGAVKQLQAAGPCGCYPELALDVAETAYRQALEAYRRNDLQDALKQFRKTLEVQPEHELARQYMELIQDKFRVAAERRVVDWRRGFNAEDYRKASAAYRELMTLNDDYSAKALDEIQNEYRRSLESLARSWMKACADQDEAEMDRIRQRAAEMVPEESIGRDSLARMSACALQRLSCLRLNSSALMSRIQTFIQISSPLLRPFQGRLVHAHIRVDEHGNTEVEQVSNGNPAIDSAVKSALEKWKFAPTLVDGRPRCVSAELDLRL
jgi:tetratricopeptide (TPR) repeat protein